ncbi:hypothetical protein LR48_Vigan161s001200 [Vigna angularis]|uniref:Uncharacterized protein n=1 Tax=Phaseolus angularis TaxID=3914 RepID=A0A0L9T541_PHAAN|nr:hypothetical protein LR48_Vigan161s001200 [Vigna angularis]
MLAETYCLPKLRIPFRGFQDLLPFLIYSTQRQDLPFPNRESSSPRILPPLPDRPPSVCCQLTRATARRRQATVQLHQPPRTSDRQSASASPLTIASQPPVPPPLAILTSAANPKCHQIRGDEEKDPPFCSEDDGCWR